MSSSTFWSSGSADLAVQPSPSSGTRYSQGFPILLLETHPTLPHWSPAVHTRCCCPCRKQLLWSTLYDSCIVDQNWIHYLVRILSRLERQVRLESMMQDNDEKLNISGHEEYFDELHNEHYGEYSLRSFASKLGTQQICLTANADADCNKFSFHVSSPVAKKKLITVSAASEWQLVSPPILPNCLN